MGYIVIWVQVDGVWGYDEDLSNFVAQVPVILGTATVSYVMNVIKEREIDALGKHPDGLSFGTAYTGEEINVMAQALHAEDGSLPQGLTMQNTYTELCSDSKNIAVVVGDSTTYPQTLRKKTPVVRAVMAT